MIGSSKKNRTQAAILESSIRRRSSIPLCIKTLPIDFEFRNPMPSDQQRIRFLSPYFWDYKEPILFLDSHLFFLCDVKELLDLYNDQYTLQSVTHNQKLASSFDQSTLMFFNSKKCQNILSYSQANQLHINSLLNFEFVESEQIGTLPSTFNKYIIADSILPHDKIINYSGIDSNLLNNAELNGGFSQIWTEEFNHAFSEYI